MSEAVSPPVDSTRQPGLPIARLTFYFGLVYFLQGVCQYTALINQPIKNYLRVTAGYDAEQSAMFFFAVGFPWMIKPIYGLISDFVPLFGYRRKTYLLLCNLAAAGFFLWMSGATSGINSAVMATPTMGFWALLENPQIRALLIAGVAVGVSVAAADVIVDALMVEFGQKTGLVARFQGIQWACIYGASMLTTVLASYLIKWYEPPKAVSVAALVCVSMPMVVLAVTWWCVPEKKARLDSEALKETTVALISAFKSPRLWFVLVFIALLAFNPGMFTPAYYYFTDKLKMEASDVAFADTYFNGGAMLGALAFMAMPTKRMSTRMIQTIGILVSAASMVPFCFIHDKLTLGIGNGIWGFGYMTGSLATLSLAAAACPRRAEGFVFAALLSASNFASSYGEVWGGRWYEGFAAQRLWVMVLLSMGFTLIALPLVPFLPRHMKPAGDDEPGPRGFPVELKS
jgi:predicted MFS family arabinose efflux permease